MGRGGKKKNKQAEPEDLGLGSLSVAEGEPSTSQGVLPSQQTVSTKQDKPDTKTVKDVSQKKTLPEQSSQQVEVKEEESEGLGLGLGGGGGKRKPRKKKKEPVSVVESAAAPVSTVESAAAPVIKKPIEIVSASVSQPSELIQKEIPPVTFWSGQGRGRGRGRGRGWNDPIPISQPVQKQVVPGAFAPQQTQAQAAPVPVYPQQTQAQAAPVPVYPQQTQAQAAPVPVYPQNVPAPAFVPTTSARARGRGVNPFEPKIAVVGASTSIPGKVPATATSRFAIPAKIPGNLVRAYKTRVITNYLEMKIQPIKVTRYDVAFKPDRPKKLLPKAFNAAKSVNFPKQVIAFDQRKNCYSLNPLWQGADDRITVNVEIFDDNNAKMSFEITLKVTGVVDLGTIIEHMRSQGTSLSTPMEAIQCVDVILQQGTLENYVKAGRQFFKRPRNPIDLSFGLEMWTGLFQSAIFTSRPFINIDVAHKGFPRNQSLIDALVNDFRLNPKQPLDRQRGVDMFNQFIKGLRVKANIGGAGVKRREYICNGLVDPPNRITFSLTDASGKPLKEITVAKYFEIEKKCRIRFPDLNCMWVGPRDKKIYYPMELLEVSYGQALNKQLNERQLSTMVREAATPPSDRLNKIKDVIQDMRYSENPYFKHFKMEIANQFFEVDAKILEAPKIDIGTGRAVDPRRGVWQANRFLKASALEAWGFIVVEADANACNCNSMIDMIMRVGRQMGMAVNSPGLAKFSVTQHELRNVLMSAQDNNLNFMFIIVSGRDKDAYHKIKRKAELEVGILTQCIKEQTASRRMNEQTVRNILLKVNSKLMGINQALDTRSIPQCIKGGGVMVVGADVTHPSPDQSSVPSIAAITASIDPKCFLYNIEMSVQTPKHEIIVDFENMMFDHLKVYRSHNQNALPRKIFVFRDGVSEGQFAQVMNCELVAVQRAYARFDRVNKPEILFLLVQKRHHTRFFTGEKNPQNVEPGTVVDTHIVHPKELDFYMVSHQAIKGTARPTRYHAVCNDGKIPSDEVEQLTYYLCHLYSRCPRAVSYPTPTYYAHLACSRAKSLTFGDRYNNVDLEKQPIRLRVLDRMLQCSRMFFV